MALVNCPECGKEVSTYAEACPNCGCPKDVILESVETTETKEYTEEELEALRKDYFDKLDELDKKYGNLSNEIEGIQKKLKEEREILDDNAQKSWTWMRSGSLWGV